MKFTGTRKAYQEAFNLNPRLQGGGGDESSTAHTAGTASMAPAALAGTGFTTAANFAVRTHSR